MAENTPRIGVLLVNVGTPQSPAAADVRRYLGEFLSDPRVIDIHPVARWLLLHLFILPFRPRRSGASYEKIWTEEGSPLLVFGSRFAAALNEALGDGFDVELGMRYGKPSLADALAALHRRGAKKLVVFPLYPQEADSSTGTSLEAVSRLVEGLWSEPELSIVPPFYDVEGLSQAVAAQGRPIVDDVDPDHVLFSFHGLPERHIRKADATGSHCLQSEDCCAAVSSVNSRCYRAQCFATARFVAEALSLEPDRWSVAFQSRLGRTPWIQPFTDVVIEEMAASGTKRLVVFCPAFVADCLETLEEIGIRARESFLAAGGEELRLVPAVNVHPIWVRTAAQLVHGAMEDGRAERGAH